MTVKNLASFQSTVLRFAKTVPPAKLGILQRKVTLQALAGITFRMPVDTGRARGNTQVTIGIPAEGEVPGAKSVDPVAAGAGTIASIQPFSIAWITNNVPYIEALEDGHSGQAPHGMYGVTLRDLEEQFR